MALRTHGVVIGDVWEVGGKTCHKRLSCRPGEGFGMLSVQINGHEQVAGEDRFGKLVFASSAREAPVVHFNGPLTLDLWFVQAPLRSERRVRLSAVVGTPGLGKGTFAMLTCDAFPDNAWPTATIEYPPKEKGGQPIVVKVRLEED